MSPASRDPEPEARTLSSRSDQEARFDHRRKLLGAVLAPLGFLATWLLTAQTLQPGGRNLAAVLVAVVVLWMTEVVPLPVTAVLGPALCVVLGVADAKTALAPFADPIVFLFIGSFILARAMMLHRLDQRIALAFLSIRWIGGHPGRVLAGLGAVTALLSMWVSNTATTAMMLPIGLGILQALHPMRGPAGRTGPDKTGTGSRHSGEHAANSNRARVPVPVLSGPQRLHDWPYATGMMLMIAFAASIGGIGTPVGSPPNLIAVGLIRSLADEEISFLRWMALAVPMVLAMGLALFVLLRLLHPTGAIAQGAGELTKYLDQRRAALGKWTAGQRNTLAAFALAVVLWTLPGFLSIVLGSGHPLPEFFESRLPEAVAALAAAGLLFLLPVDLRQGRFTLTWDEAVRIDWGVILLFGGGLSLGTLMFQTGVAEAMARGITSFTGPGSLWTLTAAAIALGIVFSETTSNTAAANMVIPVAIALAQAAQLNPVPPALGACFGASFGFMLPVSTPPNAIVYGSGLVPIPKMMRAGIFFDVLGFFTILASLRVLCPLLKLC